MSALGGSQKLDRFENRIGPTTVALVKKRNMLVFDVLRLCDFPSFVESASNKRQKSHSVCRDLL